MSLYKKREWLVIIILAVLLPLSGILLFALYRSSMKLTVAGYESFEEDSKTHKLILDYFFLERKNDLDELSNSAALSSFYESKALGISMKYGLRAILANVEREFSYLISQANMKGIPIYKRIVYLDEKGIPLVDVSIDREAESLDVELLRSAIPAYAASRPFAVFQDSGVPKVYMYEPFVFDENVCGKVIVEFSLDVFEVVLNHSECHFSALIDTEGNIVLGNYNAIGQKLSLYIPLEKIDVADSRASFFSDRVTNEQKMACAVRVFDDDWLLIHARPVSEYKKGGSILKWIILGGLLIGTTGSTILIFIVGLARRNRLQTRIDEEKKYRDRIEEAKRAVDKANEKLTQYSLNLEDMVEQRTSELKEANDELKNTQSQLVQHEKLASIGQLAAGVAHEMNTPVGFVASNFQSLESYMRKIQDLIGMYEEFAGKIETLSSADLQHEISIIMKFKEVVRLDFILEDIQVLFDDSREGLERVANIIQNLRDFSRVDEAGDFSEYDINEGIETTLVVGRNEIKYDADVNADLSEVLPIRCNAGQINQVFLNILVNAAQAIKSQNREEKGTISIRTYMDDTNVTCEISDDGPGISEEDQKKIFDPFFTTKPVGKGTGLGLSVSYDIIVSKHKGELLVDSTVGRGTKFTIKLPLGKVKNFTREKDEEQWKIEQSCS